MPEFDFKALAVRLLRGGVAPKHAYRITGELRDHLEDLKSDALNTGMSAREAEQDALSCLGTEDAIVEDIMAKPELQSWAARWPWAVYGMGPMVIFTAMVVALILILVGIGTGLKSVGFFTPETLHLTPFWLTTSIDLFFLSVMYVVPLLIAAFVCHQSAIRRAHLGWPLAGLFLLCLFGAVLDLSVTWPRAPEALGAFEVTFALAPPFPNRLETVIRALINVGLVASFLHWLRQKQATH